MPTAKSDEDEVATVAGANQRPRHQIDARTRATLARLSTHAATAHAPAECSARTPSPRPASSVVGSGIDVLGSAVAARTRRSGPLTSTQATTARPPVVTATRGDQ